MSCAPQLRTVLKTTTTVELDDAVVDYLASMIDDDPTVRQNKEPLQEALSAFIPDEDTVATVAEMLQALWIEDEKTTVAANPPPAPAAAAEGGDTKQEEQPGEKKSLTSAQRREMRKARANRQKAKTAAKVEEDTRREGGGRAARARAAARRADSSDAIVGTDKNSGAMVDLRGIILAFPGCILLKSWSFSNF